MILALNEWERSRGQSVRLSWKIQIIEPLPEGEG